MSHEKITHIDLFSGIGGFALAAESVWGQGGVQHTFCDNDPFATAVLKKHWPDAKIYGDIREFTADSEERRLQGREVPIRSSRPHETEADAGGGDIGLTTDASGEGRQQKPGSAYGNEGADERRATKDDNEPTGKHKSNERPHILTGGFPCQPFSAAGRRLGTEDDRHLWPEMLRVIREFHPRWVIGENVGGLITWNGGVVLEQVHADLEAEGYEVQAFVIPAAGVGAPHRRDRVWIVAHATDSGRGGSTATTPQERRAKGSGKTGKLARGLKGSHSDDASDSSSEQMGMAGQPRQEPDAPDAENGGQRGRRSKKRGEPERIMVESEQGWDEARHQNERRNWGNWYETATALCRVDDGLPRRMDRNPRLRALGNAIVPQVAEEIMRAIKQTDHANF